MGLRRVLVVCSAVAALSLTGCGGDAQSTPTEAEPTAAVVATPSAKAPYAGPGEMLKRARAAGVKVPECTDETPGYNVYGSLSIGCGGMPGATVYFDTFPDQAIGEAIAAAKGMPGAQYHVGQGWLVATEDPALFAQLVAALS